MEWDLDRLGPCEVYRYGRESGNLLIRGENLTVMRNLREDLAGRFKLVYIDPPFNTGGRFTHYRDDLEPQAWLAMMEERLELLRLFLRPDGVIFIHLDDSMLAYCKVSTDRIFGRENYLTTVVVQAATPSSFKTVNPGPADVTEYLLMYCRDRAAFRHKTLYVPAGGVDLHRFSRYVENPFDPPPAWRFASVGRVALAEMGFANRPEAERALGRDAVARRLEEFALARAEWVFETKTLQRPGRRLAEEIAGSKGAPGVTRVARRDRPDLYLYRGRQLYFLIQSVRETDGRRVVVQPLSNLWTDIPTSSLFAEGGVAFRYGKKPERLMARVIELSTEPGDYVLDAFAGSGTTGAVAHKLGRHWVLIEGGPQAETHALPRLQRVVDGGDRTGISSSLKWRGGGGFVFCRLDRVTVPAPAPGQAPEDPPGRTVLVAAAVIRKNGRILVAQRTDNLLWEFPGGKVRPGEDAREALQREIREELGLEIEVGKPLEVITVPAPTHLVLIFFAARILRGEPRKIECADFRWIAGGELADLPVAPADRQAVKAMAGLFSAPSRPYPAAW